MEIVQKLSQSSLEKIIINHVNKDTKTTIASDWWSSHGIYSEKG